MGTGGVGKTTISASLAIRAALEGKRVLVMTIDPSMRLKDALGLQELGGAPVKIDLEGAKGSLEASVLEPKLEFDQFIARSLDSTEEIEAILSNKLYQRISTSLAGSQEFTAIESVLAKVESKNYDLVILDTPPAVNSIDFLQAPQKFYDLFNKDMLNWFTTSENQSWFKKTLQTGTKKATQVLERLVGKDFLSEIYSFFRVIQVLAPKIQKRAALAQNLFADQNTAFALVSIYDQSKVSEAVDLSKSLRRQGYHLRHIFMNKVFPFHQAEAANDEVLKKWQSEHKYQLEVKKEVQTVFAGQVQVYEIEEHLGDIASLDALKKLGQSIYV